ncbi:MAG: cadherin-like domain-containing protein [Actinomycetia bacterium]|nr:cadherin-like domain-containing protein [Actinomycetes bacterium]
MGTRKSWTAAAATALVAATVFSSFSLGALSPSAGAAPVEGVAPAGRAMAGATGSIGAVAGPARTASDAPVAGCDDAVRALNTGHDAATGGRAAPGRTDPGWRAAGPFEWSGTVWTAAQIKQLIADPTRVDPPSGSAAETRPGWTAAFVVDDAVSSGAPNFLSPAAGWISHTADAAQDVIGADTGEDFAYLRQFDLDPVFAGDTTITLSLLANNTVAAVYVNGIAQHGSGLPSADALAASRGDTAGRGSGVYGGYDGRAPINAVVVPLSGLVGGQNTIVVQVKSAPIWQGLQVSASCLAAGHASTPAGKPVTIPSLLADGTNLPTGAVLSAVTPVEPAQGAWAGEPDGSVTFAPARGFAGEATAEYRVANAAGAPLGASTVTVTVAPELAADRACTFYGSKLTIPVLDNDAVPAGTEVIAVTQTEGCRGRWTVDPNGTITFLAPKRCGAAADSDPDYQTVRAAYTVRYPDGTTATATVAVTLFSPEQPVVYRVAHGQSWTFPFFNDDYEPPGTALTLTPADPAQGSWRQSAGGKRVTFTPAHGFIGVARADYRVTFPCGLTSQSTIAIEVAPPAPAITAASPSGGFHGTGIAGRTVTVWLPDGSSVTARVGAGGKWSVAPARLTAAQVQSLTPDAMVRAEQFGKSELGLIDIDLLTTEEVWERDVAAAPLPPSMVVAADAASGEGAWGAKITVLDATGEVLCTTTVRDDLTWRCSFPRAVAAGTVVSATQLIDGARSSAVSLALPGAGAAKALASTGASDMAPMVWAAALAFAIGAALAAAALRTRRKIEGTAGTPPGLGVVRGRPSINHLF